MWAGAHYRPIPGDTPQLNDERKLAMRTAEVMRRIAREDEEAGVRVVGGREEMDVPGEVVWGLKKESEGGEGYAWRGDGFQVLAMKEVKEGVKWGGVYDTWVVNVAVYCRWLLRGLERRGVRVVKCRLGCVDEAWDVVESLGVRGGRTVVNCSGRGFGDGKMNVIRGQTVLVRQQAEGTVTRQCKDGAWSFLIPRPLGGGTIVGGTKEVGDWEGRVRVETRERLLKRAVECFPEFVDELGKFEVLRDNVGRRPWREGGVRVEEEVLGKGRRVVHGYGAGGRGYELSWGVAERIVDLVKKDTPLRASL